MADKTKQKSKTAKIEIDGQTVELPIFEGSEGERGIDIRQLRSKTATFPTAGSRLWEDRWRTRRS